MLPQLLNGLQLTLVAPQRLKNPGAASEMHSRAPTGSLLISLQSHFLRHLGPSKNGAFEIAAQTT